MKLTFKRQDKPPIAEERKLKLESLGKKKKPKPIGFEWTLASENKEEEKEIMKNFHLFCISIVQDLYGDKFKTNEKGIIKYSIESITDKQVIYTLKNLQKLFRAVNKK